MRELKLLEGAPAACCSSLGATAMSEQDAEATAAVFKALSDPRARPDREPAGERRRARLRVRPHARARPVAADGELPPEEARAGRSARTRAARRVGVLRGEPRGARRASGGSSSWKERSHERGSGTGPRPLPRGGDRRAGRRRWVVATRDAAARRTRSGAPSCTRRPSGPSSPMPRSWRASVAATPRRSPSCARARPCSTWVRAGGSTCSCRPGGSGRPGRRYGLDMTDEMLDLARRNAAEAGAENVEFLKGYIEDVPLPDATVDVIISNCVINLSADKAEGVRGDAAGAPARRPDRDQRHRGVGRPVADGAGRAREPRRVHRRRAVVRRVPRRVCERAGFDAIEIEPTHEVADGMFAAIVRARRSD